MMPAVCCELKDIPWLLNMGQKMHEESRYQRNELNLTKVAGFFRQLINSPSGIVIRTDHGFLLAQVSQYWFSDEFFSLDYVVFVEKEARGKGEAAELIREYAERAKDLGVQPKDIMLEHSTETQSALLDKLYESLGFRQVGGYFVLKEGE